MTNILIRRKKIKNIYLRVHTDGSIVLSAPLKIPQEKIDLFLEEKSRWIAKQRQRCVAQTAIDPKESRAKLEKMLAEYLAKWTVTIGVNVNTVRIQRMKSRWGTCYPKTRTIHFNESLGLQNPEFVEYVVVHELVHLLEASHNQRFRAFMTQFLPDWKKWAGH